MNVNAPFLGFNAKMVDLEDFDPDDLANARLCIFLMATYGEGEPTDNATKFYRWAKDENRELESTFLSRLQFTVFGLGNRQYEHFNMMGKFTNKHLEKHGAKRVFEYGEGDDDGSLEEDFEAWKAKLWVDMVSQFHPDSKTQSAKDSDSISIEKIQLQFTAELIESPSSPASTPLPTTQINNSTKHFFNAAVAKVGVNRELRSGGGSTRHIEIEIGDTDVTYETADNLAVLPENEEAAVSAVSSALGFNLNDTFKLIPVAGADFRHPFPTPCSVGEALTRYFDIQVRTPLVKKVNDMMGR